MSYAAPSSVIAAVSVGVSGGFPITLFDFVNTLPAEQIVTLFDAPANIEHATLPRAVITRFPGSTSTLCDD